MMSKSVSRDALLARAKERKLDRLFAAWRELDAAFWDVAARTPDVDTITTPDNPDAATIRFNLGMLLAHTAYASMLAHTLTTCGWLPLGDLFPYGEYGDPLGAAQAGLDAVQAVTHLYPFLADFHRQYEPMLLAAMEADAIAMEEDNDEA